MAAAGSDGASCSMQDTVIHSSPVSDRSVLNAYYDRFFSRNATDRWTAARGWMTWEFTVSSSYKDKIKSIQTTINRSDNETDKAPQSPAILVSPSNSDQWFYEDIEGTMLSSSQIKALASRTSLDVSPAQYARGAHLKQSLCHPSTQISSSMYPQPRLVALRASDFEDPKLAEERVGNFSGFPAMPMLTCFYSVNDRFSMNDVDLIAPARMKLLQNIPCIAIQGGMDPICPVDSTTMTSSHSTGPILRIRKKLPYSITP